MSQISSLRPIALQYSITLKLNENEIAILSVKCEIGMKLVNIYVFYNNITAKTLSNHYIPH